MEHKIAYHADGTRCRKAVTTRDCPLNHRYISYPYYTIRKDGI